MKLDELKKDFLIFASNYNKEDLDLLLNYLYVLLQKFEVDSNLFDFLDQIESNNLSKSPLTYNNICQLSSQIVEKCNQYEILCLDTNIFLDADLDSVVATNTENEPPPPTSQNVIAEVLPDIKIVQLENAVEAVEEREEEVTTASKTKNVREISSKRKKTLKTVKKAKKIVKSIKYPIYVVNHLTKEYNIDRYPTSKKIKEIAIETKLNIMQVNKWFTDRRSKLKNTKSNRIPTHAVNQFIKLYNRNKYPSQDEIKQLEQETNVNYDQIFNWFRTRRHKLKQTEKREKKKAPSMPEHITNYLIEKYNKCKNPVRAEIEEMTIQTHLTTEKITNWFKRRRIQLKETKPNTLSDEIVKYLTDKYALNKYPAADEIKQICSEINISSEQCFNWFKTRRQRLKDTRSTKYPPEIVNYMIQKFNNEIYPNTEQVQQIASDTNLTTKQVNQWFSDRRFKLNHTQIKPISGDTTTTSNIIVQPKVKEPKKPKAPRQQTTIKANGFQSHIVEYLNHKYMLNNYPTQNEIQQMVTESGLSKRQINQWFNDKRYRSNRTKSNKYPDHVINYLIDKFNLNNYPSTEEKHKIALDTKLNTQQVNKWFEDRRYKAKKANSNSI